MRTTYKLVSVSICLVLLVACGPASNTPIPTPTTAPTSTQVAQPPTATAPPTPTPIQPPTATSPLTLTPTPVAQPPTATPAPPTPTVPAATPTTPPRMMVLEVPQSGATISSPVEIRGQVSVTPFEATLRGRVYDAQGRVVGEGPIRVAAEMGQPGTFAGLIPFNPGPGGSGKVEVAEVSPKDSSVIVGVTVDVLLAASQQEGVIEIPAAGAQVTLPLHILARVGQPGEQVVVSLRWQDGTELAQPFTTLRGEDGRGLLVNSLDWMTEGQPPQPATQPATLEIRSGVGAVLARQEIILFSANDPNTREITLYWVLGEDVQPMTTRVPKTPRIGTAALEELLWGPPPRNLAGFTTALPTPEQVLSFPGRRMDWGPRVTLRGLTIVDGVATANFSRELTAYGGGSLRVHLIREQITRTLKQFSTVREVRIAIEGQTEGALEP